MSYQSQILCRLNDMLEELRKPKVDTEVTCVSENENLYILQFSILDQTYHVYDFSGNDVTGTVTPIRCEKAEQYDVVYAGDFCDVGESGDEGTDLSRYDVIRLDNRTVVGSYFTDNDGDIVVPVDPVKGRCSSYEVKKLNLGAVYVANGDTYTLPAGVTSFAVSAQDGTFDISFDGGFSYPLVNREGVREYGNGKYPISNSELIVISSNGDIDILRETILD